MRFWLLPLCVRDAVPVQAPASASVVSSATVRGFDTSVSGGLDAGGVGRVRENAAACCVIGVAAACSSAGGAADCQVMNPGSSGVVLSSLVEGDTTSSNHTQVPTPLDFRPFPH